MKQAICKTRINVFKCFDIKLLVSANKYGIHDKHSYPVFACPRFFSTKKKKESFQAVLITIHHHPFKTLNHCENIKIIWHMIMIACM